MVNAYALTAVRNNQVPNQLEKQKSQQHEPRSYQPETGDRQSKQVL